jgi:hypothetical protein
MTEETKIEMLKILEDKIDELYDEHQDFWASLGTCNDKGDEEGIKRNRREMDKIEKAIMEMEELKDQIKKHEIQKS